MWVALVVCRRLLEWRRADPTGSTRDPQAVAGAAGNVVRGGEEGGPIFFFLYFLNLCTNGGGWFGHFFLDARWDDDEQAHPREPEENEGVCELYETWVGGPPGSEQAQELFFTSYNALDKPPEPGTVNPVALKW